MKRILILLACLSIFSSCQTSGKNEFLKKKVPQYTKEEINYTLVDRQLLDKIMFNSTVRSLNDADHGYNIVKDPTGNAPSPVVERFEVRSGDCFETHDWSDCKNDRERSELMEPGAPNKEGKTFWYGWSLYVPEEFPNVYPTKVAIAQFHQRPNPRKPAWMFQNHTGGLWINRQLGSDEYVKLIDDADLRGKWHKFVLHVHWSKKRDGFFKIWVNDELKYEHKGRTMSKPIAFFKYGIYRSFLSRSGGNVPTQIVYFSNVKKVVNSQPELLNPQ